MFRDNKREIFGFRKYKAYGLASAVIVAFFLMGGVASADEVTSAPSDTTAHVMTSPTEASADTAIVASSAETSANNAVATPETNTSAVATEANTATVSATNETPTNNATVASGAETSVVVTEVNTATVTSTNETSANNATVASGVSGESTVTTSSDRSASETTASTSTISAELTVPADRTVTAGSADSTMKDLNNASEQVFNLNVSGAGKLPANSRVEIEVKTDVDAQRAVLANDLQASSSRKIIDDDNGLIYKSVIDISGVAAGVQKEMIVKPNSVVFGLVTTDPMHRYTTYKLFVDDKLISSQTVTETYIPHKPEVYVTSEVSRYRVQKSADGRTAASYGLDGVAPYIKIRSSNLYGLYKLELSDPDARLVSDRSGMNFEDYRDPSTNTYTFDSKTMYSLTDGDDTYKFFVNTRKSASDAYMKDPSTRSISSNITVTHYYGDVPITNSTDLSTLKSVSSSNTVTTIIDEKILSEGVISATLRISPEKQDVLSSRLVSKKVMTTFSFKDDGELHNDASLPESILKLNIDNKPLDHTKVSAFLDTNSNNEALHDGRYLSTLTIDVLNADTDEVLGTMTFKRGSGDSSSVDLSNIRNLKALKFRPTPNLKIGDSELSKINSVRYDVQFSTSESNAEDWKSRLDQANAKSDSSRYELQLLNSDGSVASQSNAVYTVTNGVIAVKLYNQTKSIFVPDNSVHGRVLIPIDLVGIAMADLEKYYDVEIDDAIIKSAFSKVDSSRRLDRVDYKEIGVNRSNLISNTLDQSGYISDNIDAFTYSGTLKPGNHVYPITIKLKPKSNFVRTADSENHLGDGEITATYTLITYNEYTTMTSSLFKTTGSAGEQVYVKDKDLSALTTVANLSRSDVNHMEAMAYVPKSGLENSTYSTSLAEKVNAPTGWAVKYTTDTITGDYANDRNLNYVSDVADYSKVTAIKFVSTGTVKTGESAMFNVKLSYSGDLGLNDSIRYRSVLLTDAAEVKSTPVVAREVQPKPTTVKVMYRPDMTDPMTARLYNVLVDENAITKNYDSQGGLKLYNEKVVSISDFNSTTLKSLSAESLDRFRFSIDLSDQSGSFDYTSTTHLESEDLTDQFVNYSANKDFTITNTGKNASNATIIHYYRASKGNIVERFVDESGVEIKPQVNSGDMLAYYDYASYNYPATIETNKATYEYARTSGDQPYIVPEGTTTVTYVYRKTADKITNGSVIATYKDTEGNELAPQENVKTDAPDGEAYTTVAKTIPSSEVVEKTPEGLTKRTTTSYELTETPANATGNVVGNQTITVPYVYRKNVTVQTYGSVIATYKDEEGNELASTEKVITNQPGGTYYAAASKDIQGSAQSKVTPEGRTVTITTYKLIKTPDNETGDVVGGEIIEVPYVYRKNVEERMVPGNTPSVEIPELKVTQYQTEDGTDIKESEQGFVDAPNTIDKYQFTGTTNTNEAGDVQTHIYKLIETGVPGDAPQVDVPVLNVTRYVNEEGTEIKDAEEGLVPAPSMIGENYQFTGRTETTEDGTVQTHIYKVVEHEIPSDAPKREPEEIQITLHVDEETGKELVEYDPGLTSPKEIEHYTYTGKTTQEEGIRTHYYKKVITEIPGDAPSVEIPELKVTRYQTEDGTDIKDSETGFVDAPKTIDNYQFTGVTNMNEGNDVQTHIYAKIVTEVPGDAPQVDIPELRLTRHVSEKGKELLPIEEGSNGPRKTIGDYEYTGRTDVEGGITTHVYAPIRYELPGDAPQYDIPELKVTRHVDEKGKELIETEKGTQPPRKTIGDNEYTGRTTEKDGITTHVYTPIKHEIPGDAPQYDIPELKVTRHVDEKGKELIETEKGNQPPRKTIGDHEYTGRTTEKNGITTHVYELIKHEIPGDAPIVDVPELKVTRYVNEKGEEIKESEAGFINAPKTIGEYEFTGKTELNDGKDVQTHIYKLVEKPVTPTPDPKKPETPSPRTPEPKKPETPQPEAPKPIETPKSNDSKPVVAESVDQPQFVKNELPKTGETNSNLALVGVSLLTALGLIGFVKRKRED